MKTYGYSQTEITENDISTQTEITENDTLNLLGILKNQAQLIDEAENTIIQLKEGLEEAKDNITYRDNLICELINTIELKDCPNNSELNSEYNILKENDSSPSSRNITPECNILNEEIQQLDKSFLNRTIDVETYQNTLNETIDAYQNILNNPTIIITPPDVMDVTEAPGSTGVDSPTETSAKPYRVDHTIIQIDLDT